MPVTDKLVHQINGKRDIICRGQAPGTVGRKNKGEVLVVVITDTCQIVENCTSKYLFHIRIWKSHFPAYFKQLLIRNRFSIQCLQTVAATCGYDFDKRYPTVDPALFPHHTYYIGTLVDRATRNARIDARLDARLAEGLVDEVRGLLDGGIPAETLIYYGLEYKFVTQHVLGILSYDEMRTLLGNAIHQFAKRQMTWFRGMERDGIVIHWTEV